MTFTFAMNGRLESLNQTIRHDQNPRYRFFGARRRKMIKLRIAQWVLYAKVPKFTGPVKIHIRWVEKDRRRDRDNIRAGSKVILDTLVKQQRIKNDSQKWLLELTDSYEVDKANPRVEVTISDALPDVCAESSSTSSSAPA
jgi:Holliday junction resolvase RusA-like endonuclease